jgi:acyl-coenzyme A thioesterase PaaI-like protein
MSAPVLGPGALPYRDEILAGITYLSFPGIRFAPDGPDLTTILPFAAANIGNPTIPALHGGVTAAFLEVTAIISLSWAALWEGAAPQAAREPLKLPRTVNFTVDFLRAGLPREAYARARIMRPGRRFASVQVEAWQDDMARPYATGLVHLQMHQPDLAEPPAT